jgi:uncharacterized protein YjiS (DUF1127 family)
MAYVNSSRVARVSLGERIVAFVTVVREAAARRATYQQTQRELNSLTDRELADLGMVRNNIDAVARSAAYGK